LLSAVALCTGVLFAQQAFAQQAVAQQAFAQQAKRPRLVGISRIVVRAHSLDESRKFYGDLLGFQEAITVRKDRTAVLGGGLPADQVSEVHFKVNNRQYIVVMPESAPDEVRFARYAMETDDIEAMRAYLKVTAKVETTATRDLAFQTSDPDGTPIEIMQYTAKSLSVQSVGKYLSDAGTSRRIIHAGFSISKPETVRFYRETLATREFWRSDSTMATFGRPSPKVTGQVLSGTSNMKLPESDDYVEWSVSRTGSPSKTAGHIALLTPVNMEKTLADVKSRPAFKTYKQKHEAHVGVNHKWQGNFFDPDGTRTEFMEHDTVDGLPSPLSKAPFFP